MSRIAELAEEFGVFSFGLTILRFLKAIVRSWSIPAFRAGFALAMLILLSGTLFYRGVEGWSWVDSLYFSVTTISTVGLGDLAPQTDIGKLFTVVYIFVGVGIFVALFAQFARALLKLDDDEGRSGSSKTPGRGRARR